MRVLSLASSLTHGGAETVLVDLVLGLAEHEHRVVHSSAARGITPHRSFLASLRHAGVPCADILLDSLGTARGRRRAFGDFHPDVVIHHWWGRDTLRPWMLEGQNEPLDRRPHFVCVLHHAEIPAPPGYDRYVVVAESQMTSVAPLVDPRVHLIPNGVDLRRFRAIVRTATRRSPVVVGRLSRLSPDKIANDWVRTAASFELPRTRFVVAGAGPLLPTLRKEVEALNLGGRFELPGYVARSRVPALLETFDVFCHVTSTAVECHPLALLEALAAGIPVVAEARGGIPTIVTDGVNGLLASSPDDVGCLLRRLCGNAELRARLANGARRTARKFSLSRQLDGYRRLLTAIERERSRGRRGHPRQVALPSQCRRAELTAARGGQLPARERPPDLHEGFGVPELQERGLSQVAER